MRRVSSLALSLCLVVGVAACGSSDSKGTKPASAAEKPYVAALMKSYENDEDMANVFTKKQTECIATGGIQVVGVDRLKKEGITPEKLATADEPFEGIKMTEKQANALYDLFDDCGVDLKKALIESIKKDPEAGESADAVAGCLETALTDDALRKMMTSSYTSGSSDASMNDPAMAPLMGCMMLGMGDADFSVDSGTDTGTDAGN